jgi:acetoin utilization deacetylase AcuC-like enzyme
LIYLYYSPVYVGSGYSFDTTRKAKWVADSLLDAPIPGIELVEPSPLTERDVARVHRAHFVDAVRTGQSADLAESQGFEWDQNMWPMVLASNGGVVAAALSALSSGVAGSLSSGLHHARADRGAGFCTFNGLVIAARQALSGGAERF